MGTLIEDSALRDRVFVFADRTEAGNALVTRLDHYHGAGGFVLAIPAGGVPVAMEISRGLLLPWDVVIVRKVQVPGNTEVGFGAMDPEGEVLLNASMLSRLALSEKTILQQIEKTRKVIEQRTRKFRMERPFPDLANKVVILVDDGLASGYTLKAAVRYVRKGKPFKIVAAVPTGARYSAEEMLPEVDELVCLNVRSGYPYAVADAYREWRDIRDEEVLVLLVEKNSGKMRSVRERQ